MSRERLARALSQPVERLVRQFGDRSDVRRPEVTRGPDNSPREEWRTIPGVTSPFPVLLARMTEADRLRSWGTELAAEVQAYVPLSVGVQVGDVLRPTTGSFAGIPHQVVEWEPNDYGGLAALALTRVPPRPDFGF